MNIVEPASFGSQKPQMKLPLYLKVGYHQAGKLLLQSARGEKEAYIYAFSFVIYSII